MKKTRWYLYSFLAVLLVLVWLSPAKAQVTIAPGGMGDVLLGAIYDVRKGDNLPATYNTGERGDNWQNFIEIENTTNDWVAVHLRFREGQKSLEVWDHPILLSPKDIFWFYLTDTPEGYTRIGSSDFKTLYHSGLISKTQFNDPNFGEWSDTFSTWMIEAVDGVADPVRTQLGEFEVIGMFAFDGTERPTGFDTADDLIHTLEWDPNNRSGIIVNSYNGDYADSSVNIFDILHSMWGDTKGDAPQDGSDCVANNFDPASGYCAVNDQTIAIDPTGPANYNAVWVPLFATEVQNGLKGTVALGDGDSGQFQIYDLVALEDFRVISDPTRHRDGKGVIAFPPDLYKNHHSWGPNQEVFVYTDSEIAWYINPDWATAKGPTLRDGTDYSGAYGDFNGVWSLDDVDLALAKVDIWTFFMNGDPFGNGMYYNTDIILTLPTKYLHFNYSGFPYWNGFGQAPWNWTRKLDYLAAVATYRSGSTTGSIDFVGYVWNTEEYTPPGSFGPSPDYAIWPKSLPHEVNIIRMFDLDLEQEIIPGAEGFEFGHIKLTNWRMTLRHTALPQEDVLPIIGVSSRIHFNGTIAHRSAMHNWAFVPFTDTP